MCNTENIKDKTKTLLHTKHYYLMVLYLGLVRGQYLYSRAKSRGIAPIIVCFIVSLLPLGGLKEYPWYSQF